MEMGDGVLYIKLQPTTMLASYHRWLFELKCVEVLREYVVQEVRFHTRALKWFKDQVLERVESMIQNC